jgi:hypothetical protein
MKTRKTTEYRCVRMQRILSRKRGGRWDFNLFALEFDVISLAV